MFRIIRRYLSQVAAQIDRDGIDVDETFNAVSGGTAGMTVSMRAAMGAGWRADGRTGPRKFGWCVMCRFLGVFVQPGHCRLQFVPGPTDWLTWVRAGLAFSWGVYSLFHLWSLGIDLAIFAIFALVELASRVWKE